MIDMLMKQLLGNVDMAQIKVQVQEFAQTFADMHRTVKASHDAILRLERLIKINVAQDGTLTEERNLSNDNSDHNGNRTEQPIAGIIGGDSCGSDNHGSDGNGAS